MNRAREAARRSMERVPRTRGDEPILGLVERADNDVFPAPAGTNWRPDTRYINLRLVHRRGCSHER